MARWPAIVLGSAVWLVDASVAPGAMAARADDTTRVVVLAPKAADSADTTHAALLISRERYSGRVAFAGRVATIRQLRVGSPPNPWECAWLVWNYQDEQHFYYVALKPTGWEIGKRDPAYPGGQRFLASGAASYPLGVWHDFLIVQERNAISVRVNGAEIASYVDGERPYLSGNLGLYVEDAEAQLDDVTAPFADDFENYPLLTDDTEGHIINNWTTPFLGYGQVVIADRKR